MKIMAFLLMALMIIPIGTSAWAETNLDDTADKQDAIVTITSFDGVKFDGRLRLPDADKVERLVIFVNGSGPNTYDNRRSAGDGKEFLYHDLFANELNRRGAAYFSYNTRGVTPRTCLKTCNMHKGEEMV